MESIVPSSVNTPHERTGRSLVVLSAGKRFIKAKNISLVQKVESIFVVARARPFGETEFSRERSMQIGRRVNMPTGI